MEGVYRPVWVNLSELGNSTRFTCVFERILELVTRKLVRVRGPSMYPAFSHGGWVRVSRRAYRRRRPARFDVVRFRDPARPGKWSIKRIVGLPLEFVELRDGRLTVDGAPVDEPHAAGRVYGNHAWAPREGEYVALGDNRAASTDSRKYGPVRLGDIDGAVVGHFRAG